MKRLLSFALVSAALMFQASSAQAAVRWDWTGALTCWGGTPTAWGPGVASSGYVAWRPVFVWLPDTAGIGYKYHYGQWRYAYRDSVWRNFTAPNPVHNTQPSPVVYSSGAVWVYNQIYDYDTGASSGAWANWWERDPATSGYYDTGTLSCRY